MTPQKAIKILSEELHHSCFHLNESGKAPQFYKEMGDYCEALLYAIRCIQREFNYDLLDVNRCVCCGEIIPEGRQVCPNCEGGRKND